MRKLMISKRNIRSERGASAVEFALILPVLLLVLFGLIEFGSLYHDYLAITHATREGARMAAVNQFDPAEVAARAALPIDPPIKEYPNGSDTGDPVRVTVTYKHQWLTGYLSPVFGSDITLSSQAEMRLEQPGN